MPIDAVLCAHRRHRLFTLAAFLMLYLLDAYVHSGIITGSGDTHAPPPPTFVFCVTFLSQSTKRSTWNAPDDFADTMTCVWDPWPVPYSSPLDKPCRRVFT